MTWTTNWLRAVLIAIVAAAGCDLRNELQETNRILRGAAESAAWRGCR